MKNYRELGNKYIKHRKKRAVLVSVSMVLTTVLIYMITTFFLNVYSDFSNQVKEQYNFHAKIAVTDKEQREAIKNHVSVEDADFAFYDEKQWFKDYHDGGNVPLYYVDSFEQNTFNFTIVDGRVPENSDEILICQDNLHLFHEEVNVGSYVTLQVYDLDTWQVISEKEYMISGIYNYDSTELISGLASSSFTLGTDDMDMAAYVRFENSKEWEKSVYQLAESVGVDVNKPHAYEVNEPMEIVYFRGDNMASLAMVAMVYVFVVYITMVMIRSLFTSNLNDNVTEFCILKAMGATDKKIKSIFKREVYLEGLFAFGVGVVISLILSFILGNKVNLYAVNFSFAPMALIFTFIILYITISLAIIEPLNILKKVPVVEGIRANYAINNMKNKKRKGKFFRIFGIEGEYAYKNLRRNSKSFWNGVASFTISTLLLALLVTVYANLGKMIESEGGTISDAYDYYTNMDAANYNEEELQEVKNILNNPDYVDVADAHYSYYYNMADDKEILPLTDAINDPNVKSVYGRAGNSSANVEIYTKEQLEYLNEYMCDGVDAKTIMDGGVIIMGTCNYFDLDTEETKSVKVIDAAIGDKVDVLKVEKAIENAKIKEVNANLSDESMFAEMEIEGFCDNIINPYGAPFTIILSYEYLVQHCGLDLTPLCDGFYIKTNEEFVIMDEVELEEVVYKNAGQYGFEYFNELRWYEEQISSYKFIVIGAVAFVLIMGIVSILNNMVSEYQVRRREVSILRSIGMSKKGLNKMLILEKIIMGLIAWLIGILLACVLARSIFTGILYMYETTFVIPWLSYLLIGVGVIGIMVLISMISVVSMGKMDITEGVRNQE